jgi:hypothetical protein
MGRISPGPVKFNFARTLDRWNLTLLTINAYVGYAQTIGTAKNPAYNKIAIGVSCMEPSSHYYTPLNDVISLCKYEPSRSWG